MEIMNTCTEKSSKLPSLTWLTKNHFRSRIRGSSDCTQRRPLFAVRDTACLDLHLFCSLSIKSVQPANPSRSHLALLIEMTMLHEPMAEHEDTREQKSMERNMHESSSFVDEDRNTTEESGNDEVKGSNERSGASSSNSSAASVFQGFTVFRDFFLAAFSDGYNVGLDGITLRNIWASLLNRDSKILFLFASGHLLRQR